MDPIKILKRAWHILWSYRTLWVFGLILALAGAGSSGNGGGNNGYQYDSSNQNYNPNWQGEMPRSFEEAWHEMGRLFREGAEQVGLSSQEWNALLWIAVSALVFFVLLGIVTAVFRYMAETSVLKMVDEYENSGQKMTFRQGFRLGWSRTSWRLFLINLIVHLPVLVMIAILIVAGISIYRMVTVVNPAASAVGVISVIGMVFLTLFATILFEIFLGLLRQFFWRACAFEDLGVYDSLARGWAMFRENWKSIGVMWLVMIGLGIAWILVSIILVIVSLPVIAITAILGAAVAAIPGLILAGVFSLFLDGYLVWIAAILFIMPLFFVIAFSPWLLLGSWQTVFTSSVWTLVYRELKAIPDATPLPEIPPTN